MSHLDDLENLPSATFAGIGVWSHSLRLAGWPADDSPVWTGLLPVPAFSAQQGEIGLH